MAAMDPSPLLFEVQRQPPVLVAPAKATPYEFKLLSDIDDQESLRIHFPVVQFYRNDARGAMRERDPALVLREALAKALVFCYPFAGRLRERPGGKLVVECTGEGVVFVEADTQVRLEQLDDALHPPFPCFQELLYDVPGTQDILNCPLLLIQVTRLACGGFIVALRFNHTMSDTFGFVQFMKTMAAMARGAIPPRVTPEWHRDLLTARHDPRITCVHNEYNRITGITNGTLRPLNQFKQHSFFFRQSDISAIRAHVAPHLRPTSTTFDLLTACLWRCRTIALRLEASREVRVHFAANVRSGRQPPLPRGYYGNAVAFPCAALQVGKLYESALGDTFELVKKAKAEMTEDYMQSAMDLMVLKGRPPLALDDLSNFFVADMTMVGFENVDFGWGKPIYGGPAKAGQGMNAYFPFKDGVLVIMCLPKPYMERFSAELCRFLDCGTKILASFSSISTRSAL